MTSVAQPTTSQASIIHPGHQHHHQGAPSSSSSSHHPSLQRLASLNESTWYRIGALAETMGDVERAMNAFECALRHNPYSVAALTQLGTMYKIKENYPKAAEYLQRVLNIENTNGEVWVALGHVYLMMDELQKAYSAYQQSLVYMSNPKEPKLWFGIGLLYERNGSLEYAEEAFATVMKIDPHFEKMTEVYFRLSVILKKLGKFDHSLQYLKYILSNPPAPLTELDIWFQIGHVHEQRKDYNAAKECYERILSAAPNHARVLQQLGWLHQIEGTPYLNPDVSLSYLNRSLEYDNKDAQTWYLIGRCRMMQQEFNKAYDAFHEAVIKDGTNPAFWCSIGVLYYQIKQYLDALNAYTRSIGINPYISEIWYDLGTLYEACKNQPSDAIDAYTRALELDPSNQHIQRKIQFLKAGGTNVNVEKNIQIKLPSFYTGPRPPTLSREDSRRRKENVIQGPSLLKELAARLQGDRQATAPVGSGGAAYGGPAGGGHHHHHSQSSGGYMRDPSSHGSNVMDSRKFSAGQQSQHSGHPGAHHQGRPQVYGGGNGYDDPNLQSAQHRRQSIEPQYVSVPPNGNNSSISNMNSSHGMRVPQPRPLDMNIDTRYQSLKSSPASATYNRPNVCSPVQQHHVGVPSNMMHDNTP